MPFVLKTVFYPLILVEESSCTDHFEPILVRKERPGTRARHGEDRFQGWHGLKVDIYRLGLQKQES